MRSELFNKNRLILFGVILAVIVFVSLVWIIASNTSWSLPGFPALSPTAAVARVDKNCTYPAAYWGSHPELFPGQVVLGDKVFTKNEISQALIGNAPDDQARLQGQLFAAYLNILSGADQAMIQATIFQAYESLVDHAPGSQLQPTEHEVSTRLYTLLETYNLGLAGIAACQGASAFAATGTGLPTQTLTLQSTGTRTPTLTTTPSPTPTATPSETPTSTLETILPIWTAPAATPTRSPTTEPPGPPPATETQSPPPAPTNTPKPPTQEPSPTFTLPPPPNTLPPPP